MLEDFRTPEEPVFGAQESENSPAERYHPPSPSPPPFEEAQDHQPRSPTALGAKEQPQSPVDGQAARSPPVTSLPRSQSEDLVEMSSARVRPQSPVADQTPELLLSRAQLQRQIEDRTMDQSQIENLAMVSLEEIAREKARLISLAIESQSSERQSRSPVSGRAPEALPAQEQPLPPVENQTIGLSTTQPRSQSLPTREQPQLKVGGQVVEPSPARLGQEQPQSSVGGQEVKASPVLQPRSESEDLVEISSARIRPQSPVVDRAPELPSAHEQPQIEVEDQATELLSAQSHPQLQAENKEVVSPAGEAQEKALKVEAPLKQEQLRLPIEDHLQLRATEEELPVFPMVPGHRKRPILVEDGDYVPPPPPKKARTRDEAKLTFAKSSRLYGGGLKKLLGVVRGVLPSLRGEEYDRIVEGYQDGYETMVEVGHLLREHDLDGVIWGAEDVEAAVDGLN